MWFGILPFVGLIVLGAAIVLTARTEKLPPQVVATEDTSVVHARYRKGMRALGNGLIFLGVLWGIATALFVTINTGDPPITGVFVGVMAVLYMVLGVFARGLRAWVNYVVAVLACLQLVILFLSVTIVGQRPGRAAEGIGTWLGLIVAAALLYYSINNIQVLRRAKVRL
jgi:hypothetical protein